MQEGNSTAVNIYVTAEWIRDKCEKQNRECCILCKCPFEIMLDNGDVKSKLIVYRIDNREAHTKEKLSTNLD